MKLDHINISAPMELLREVRDFYCSVLGLKEGYRPDFGQKGFWLYSTDKPLIHLSESDAVLAGMKQGHLNHVAFQTTGLEDMTERLKSKNIEYRSCYIAEINMSQLFFHDPAGTCIEVNFLNESTNT
jgi:catechol-2,3-dioxygenase